MKSAVERWIASGFAWMPALLSVLRPGGFVFNLGVYTIAIVLSQALPFLLLPIITRYLSPDQYGSLALFNVLFVFCSALVGVSMTTVVSKEFFRIGKEEMAELFPNLLLFLAASTIIVFCTLAGASGILSRWLGLPRVWLMVTPILAGFFIIHQLNCVLLRNLKRPFQFGIFQISATGLELLLSLLLIIVLGFGWQGRAMGTGVAFGVAALAGLANIIRLGYWRWVPSWTVLRRAVLVTLPLIPNSVFAITIAHSAKLFLNAGFEKADIGLYAIGQQVAMIVFFLGQSFMLGWGPFVFENLTKQETQGLRLVLRGALVFSFGIFGIALAVFLGSGFVLRIMTTPEYYGARQFVGWLSAGYAFWAIYSLFVPLLVYRNSQHTIAIISGVGASANLLLNLVLIHYFGMRGAAIAFMATYVLMFSHMMVVVQKLFRPPWRELFQLDIRRLLHHAKSPHK